MKLSEVILQIHRYTTTLPKLLSNSDEKQKSFIHNTFIRWLKAGEFDLRIQWSPFFLEGFLKAYNHAYLAIF